MLKNAAIFLLSVGLASSVLLTLYVGRHNRSAVLVGMFLVWVATPFFILLRNNVKALQPPSTKQYWLHALSIFVSVISILSYSLVALGYSSKPAFAFLIVPFVSVVLIVAWYVTFRGSARDDDRARGRTAV